MVGGGGGGGGVRSFVIFCRRKSSGVAPPVSGRVAVAPRRSVDSAAKPAPSPPSGSPLIRVSTGENAASFFRSRTRLTQLRVSLTMLTRFLALRQSRVNMYCQTDVHNNYIAPKPLN